DRADHFQIPGAADSGDLRAIPLRDLHSERPDPTRRSDNQDLFCRPDLSNIAKTCRAVTAARGTVAACSKLRLVGFNARSRSGADTYSANPPSPTKPKTSSPGRNRVTALPTASTSPATSLPRSVWFGLRTPIAAGRAI